MDTGTWNMCLYEDSFTVLRLLKCGHKETRLGSVQSITSLDFFLIRSYKNLYFYLLNILTLSSSHGQTLKGGSWAASDQIIVGWSGHTLLKSIGHLLFLCLAVEPCAGYRLAVEPCGGFILTVEAFGVV